MNYDTKGDSIGCIWPEGISGATWPVRLMLDVNEDRSRDEDREFRYAITKIYRAFDVMIKRLGTMVYKCQKLLIV